MACRSAPVSARTVPCVRGDAELAGDRHRGAAVVAGDHLHADAGARGPRRSRRWPRGAAGRRCRRRRGTSGPSSRSSSAIASHPVGRADGRGEHPQAAGGQRVDPLVPRGPVQRPEAAVAARARCRDRSSSRSGAPTACTTRRRPRRRRRPGSPRTCARTRTAPRRPARCRRCPPRPSPPSTSQRALGGLRRRRASRPSVCSTRASLHRPTASTSAARSGCASSVRRRARRRWRRGRRGRSRCPRRRRCPRR